MAKHVNDGIWIVVSLLWVGLFMGCGGISGDDASSVQPIQYSSFEQLTPGYHQQKLMHQGIQRGYKVYVPQAYDGTMEVPLVLDFHGFAATADWIAKTSGFKEQAEKTSAQFPQGFVVVYPKNTMLNWGWNADTCCGFAEAFNIDDEGFVFAAIDHVSSKVKIDPKRIYLTGHSNGAMLSQYMASKYPEFFAAIAPVSSSSVVWRYYQGLAKDRSIPVIMYSGLSDTCAYDPSKCPVLYKMLGILLVGLPSDYVGFDTNFDLWAERCGCTKLVTNEDRFSTAKSVYTASYTDCYNDVEVVKWAVKAAHDDVYQNDIYGSNYVDIAKTAWAFMSRFTSNFEKIFTDDFEQEDLSKWEVSNKYMQVYTYYFTEHSARLAKQQSIERIFDLSNFKGVVLRYQWRTRNLDAGEYGYVEWSTDGIYWTQIERVKRHFDTSWSSSSVRIDEGAGKSTFHLRFRVDGSNSREYFYVDNIVLAAIEK